MPSMPRSTKEFKKIAYNILGEPPALVSKKTKKQKKYDEQSFNRTAPNSMYNW